MGSCWHVQLFSWLARRLELVFWINGSYNTLRCRSCRKSEDIGDTWPEPKRP